METIIRAAAQEIWMGLMLAMREFAITGKKRCGADVVERDRLTMLSGRFWETDPLTCRR
jgi:hypothetical protein